MSMSAFIEIDIGFRFVSTLAKIFNLPVPKSTEDFSAELNLREVKKWLDLESNSFSINQIENIGMGYKLSRVIGLENLTLFQAGLAAINGLFLIQQAMLNHATNYISDASYKCTKGKTRRDELRKFSKKYRFTFV